MKKTLLRSIKMLMIVAAISLSCFGCDTAENIDDNPNLDVPIAERNDTVDNTTDENITEEQITENDETVGGNTDESITEVQVTDETEEETDEITDEEKSFESKLLSSSPSLNLNYNTVLVNNVPVSLDPFLAEANLFDPIDPEQILDFKCGRFVFLKDGSIIDIKKKDAEDSMIGDIKQNYEQEEWDYFISQSKEISESFLNELNKTVGIKDIRHDRIRGTYYVFNADGTVYSMKSKYATKYSEVENPVLKTDGTLNCPEFPETAEWTDIVDYRMCDRFILGLTSDGKLLSAGIEFEHENIKMFDIFNFVDIGKFNGDFPVAVTNEGKMIFGDLPDGVVSEENIEKLETAIEKAETFTDVKDFVFQWGGKGPVIIVRKTDGSLWATKNDGLFNPEYVNVQ